MIKALENEGMRAGEGEGERVGMSGGKTKPHPQSHAPTHTYTHTPHSPLNKVEAGRVSSLRINTPLLGKISGMTTKHMPSRIRLKSILVVKIKINCNCVSHVLFLK